MKFEVINAKHFALASELEQDPFKYQREVFVEKTGYDPGREVE